MKHFKAITNLLWSLLIYTVLKYLFQMKVFIDNKIKILKSNTDK